MKRKCACRPITYALNTGLLFVGVVVALLVGEMLVRYVAPQGVYRFPKGLFVADPVLEHRLTPRFSGVASTSEYKTAIRTNSMGFREDKEYGTKPKDTYRILAIGDSFTMGVAVELDQSFVKLLEKSLSQRPQRRYEVINAGIPGFDTRQELVLITRYGRELNPDLILLNFYVGNDITDNYQRTPAFVVDGYYTNGRPEDGLLPGPTKLFLQTHSHLYCFVWPLLSRLRHPDATVLTEERRSYFLSIYTEPRDPEVEAMWNATWSQLQEVAATVNNDIAPVVVIVIPDRLQVHDAAWLDVKAHERRGVIYRRDAPNRRIAEFCERLKLPVVDLLPVMADATKRGALYFTIDGHWTPLGNEVAASAVADFLSMQSLIPFTRSARLRDESLPTTLGSNKVPAHTAVALPAPSPDSAVTAH